jgi:hypothetical protein
MDDPRTVILSEPLNRNMRHRHFNKFFSRTVRMLLTLVALPALWLFGMMPAYTLGGLTEWFI